MKGVVFSLFLGLAVHGYFCNGLQNITVGYLPSMFSFTEKGLQGYIVSGAISYAIQKINDDPLLLPHHRLNLIWQQAKREEMQGARALANMIRSDAVAFFGPECSCSSSAIVAGAFNLPIISHRCSEYTLSDHSMYPTFARTVPSDMSLAKALMSLLKTYSWSNITMVVEGTQRSQILSEAVSKQADMNNIIVQDILTYTAPVSTLDNDEGEFSTIIMKSYKKTRIYVFIGVNDINGLMAFLKTLQTKGLLDNGEYKVIYLDLDVYYKDEPQRYFTDGFTHSENWRDSPLVDAVKSLLVITLNPPIAINNENEDFEEKVNWFLKQSPFNFPATRTKKITVFGYYLYDAVFLYARALHQQLIESNSSEEESIRDGQGIINRMRNIHYKSITGHTVHINNNGDVVSKFYLLARKPLQSQYANISLLPVGEFTDEEEPVLNLFEINELKKGKPPTDNIPCDTDCNLTVKDSVYKSTKKKSHWLHKLLAQHKNEDFNRVPKTQGYKKRRNQVLLQLE